MQIRPSGATQLESYHLQSEARGCLSRVLGLGWVSSTQRVFTTTVSSSSETCVSKYFSVRLAGYPGGFSILLEERVDLLW